MNKLFARVNIFPALTEILLALIFMTLFSHFANATALDETKQLVKSEVQKTVEFENIGIKFVKGQAYLNNIKSDNLVLTSLSVDNKRNIFTGYVSANNALPIFISGRFFKSQQVPVLNINAERASIIKAENISYLEMSADEITERNIIADAAGIIGKSPSRNIYKNRPIVAQQISAAILIPKQQEVAILFKTANMEIKDVGIAIDNGAKGDVIRIRNKNSGKIINATVVNEKTVAVSNSGQEVAKLEGTL